MQFQNDIGKFIICVVIGYIIANFLFKHFF